MRDRNVSILLSGTGEILNLGGRKTTFIATFIPVFEVLMKSHTLNGRSDNSKTSRMRFKGDRSSQEERALIVRGVLLASVSSIKPLAAPLLHEIRC